jgi:hypothetical protein
VRSLRSPDSQTAVLFARGSFAALGIEKRMRNGILAAIVMLCACSPLEREVSRVSIPETVLAVVVVRDEKGLYRYRVFESSSPVSKQRVFGGSATDAPLQPRVTETGGLVRVSWSQEGREVAFLEFDRRTGQLVVDSNLTDRPPPIERQNRPQS